MSVFKGKSSNSPKDAHDVLKAFIAHNPQARYTFESERNSPESEICRQGAPPGSDCITVRLIHHLLRVHYT
ncbi:hypothetical protein D9615_001658 [Tricholomella constricta]|uniref:Uncharacterized protein n=1 Tax=Tricholomella constricta TaxID=117010 RepID=A0A8H5MAQ9_9AGAR|nr:hypothetical protein D9615_001658 [Tricholomella constricta]